MMRDFAFVPLLLVFWLASCTSTTRTYEGPGGAVGSLGGNGGASVSGSGATGAGGALTDGGSDSSSDADSGPLCIPTAEKVAPIADSIINSGQCNGSIENGNAPTGNIGVGRAVLRFQVSADAYAALFDSSRIQEVKLTLSRCVNSPSECAGVAAAGQLAVAQLRNDWDEGDGTSYAGADWCRRLAGNPGPQWGAQGASAPGLDRAANYASQVAVDTAQPSVDFTLDPTTFDAGLCITPNTISFLVVPVAGAMFMYSTRENADVYPQPALTISYCPP